MRKVLTMVALLCALGLAGVQAATKKAPAAQAPDALYPCTEDCNTREGGYRWAEHYAIAKADDCKGSSVAFVNGCKDFVSEIGRPREQRSDDRDDRRYGDNRYGNEDRYGDDDQRYRDDDRRYRDDDRYRDDRDERYGDDNRYDDDEDGYDENDNDNDNDNDDGDYDDDDDDDDDRGGGGGTITGSLHA